jgi:UDP-N-acetylmuramate dehydrogenase
MMAAQKVDEHPVVRHDESMVVHTSWRVGGTADVYCEPRNVAELRAFLIDLPASMPRMQRELERISETRVRAGAGVACARLAKQCEQWELGPAAFMVGIPGTIGGALAMNAGAFGGETWSHVESVETIDRAGVIRERPRSDFEIGYRSVAGPEDEWFLAATFSLESCAEQHKDEDETAIRSLLSRRAASQPLGQPSCGSVFRNPRNGFAGELIESCGLKGARIGGAVVSEKHANFIVNDGNATAADIEALIEHVRERVLETTGIELQSEVRIVGEVADARKG